MSHLDPYSLGPLSTITHEEEIADLNLNTRCCSHQSKSWLLCWNFLKEFRQVLHCSTKSLQIKWVYGQSMASFGWTVVSWCTSKTFRWLLKKTILGSGTALQNNISLDSLAANCASADPLEFVALTASQGWLESHTYLAIHKVKSWQKTQQEESSQCTVLANFCQDLNSLQDWSYILWEPL